MHEKQKLKGKGMTILREENIYCKFVGESRARVDMTRLSQVMRGKKEETGEGTKENQMQQPGDQRYKRGR